MEEIRNIGMLIFVLVMGPAWFRAMRAGFDNPIDWVIARSWERRLALGKTLKKERDAIRVALSREARRIRLGKRKS